MHSLGGGVELHYSAATDSTSVVGAAHCASPWACSVCAPRIREARARELDALFTLLDALGYVLLFVTPTVSHERGSKLRDLMRAFSDSYSWSMNHHQFKGDSAYVGQVRAWDFTHGKNGWHPHQHNVFVFKPGTSWAEAERLVMVAGERFSRRLSERHGVRTAIPGPGWHVQQITAAGGGVSSYVSKVDGGWGTGLEVARGDLKRGRGSQTPWQLLERAVRGDVAAAWLWSEYEAATKGLHAIQIGRLLKALAREHSVTVTDEGDDASLLVGVVQGPDYVELFTASEWSAYVRKGLLADLLEGFTARGRSLCLALSG
jgi:hypothetical protein